MVSAKMIPCRQAILNGTLYKTEGVYIIIGGAGGIGEVWSEYMIRTYQSRIISNGRRKGCSHPS